MINSELKLKIFYFKKKKFEFNKKILDQINEKEFNQTSFNKFGYDVVEKIKLNSIKDDEKFESNSIEILYSLPVNSFTLIADENNNVYIAKTIEYEEQFISKDSKEFKKISSEAISQNKIDILKSYDLLLNNKYKVVINYNTLDRVKNYFK